MKFPAYVPAGVRSHVLAALSHSEADQQNTEGELACTKEAVQDSLQSLESMPESKAKVSQYDSLRALQMLQIKLSTRRDSTAAEIARIKRLVTTPEMKEVYRILADAFFELDEEKKQVQFRNFIHIAWTTWQDFDPFREGLKRAKELRDEIGDTAEKLAGLLDELYSLGLDLPREFGLPDLAQMAMHPKLAIRNDPENADRIYAMGEPALAPMSDGHDRDVENLSIEPTAQRFCTLPHALASAPTLYALVNTVAQAARNWTPSESGYISAAISSQKRNPKTEYLRAFSDLLFNAHGIALTPSIMRAVAIAGNVVIDDPENQITYDDVRKAVAQTR